MKTSKYFAILLVAALSLTACNDWMNTVPEGATKTTDQKADAGQQNPSAAAADVSAIYAQFIQRYAGLGDIGIGNHSDFGYASICMFLEEQGQDYVSPNIGYNWFRRMTNWTGNRDNTLSTGAGEANTMTWKEFYKIILACNNVIASVDRANPGTQRYSLSQALAVRAFCYLQLASLYQFTYSDATLDKLCVPIVKENMTAEELESNPRATVAKVYELIMSDLNYACDSLEGFVRADKGYVNQAVAFGLRARANLVMQKWAEAAADADQALKLSGATPLSIAEANEPGFTDAATHNVLWANIIVETNSIVLSGIINWPSHMSIFYTDGYTSVGATRHIASALFDEIPATDVRKGWWLDESLNSPLLDAPIYNLQKASIQGKAANKYINVKFGTGDRTNTGNAAAAADWIIMRAEELWLIKAEGLARANGDASTLIEFVQTYRDPAYSTDIHGLSLEDEIWWQRRVELWGEGFAWGDIMRLGKGIVRTNSKNWPEAVAKQDVEAGRNIFLWRIPQAEIEANKGISEEDNNPIDTY